MNKDLVQYLVDYGANMDIKNKVYHYQYSPYYNIIIITIIIRTEINLLIYVKGE